MNPIRQVNVLGKTRNVFLCGCGVEIFFYKSGEEFQKYVAPEADDPEGQSPRHVCDFIQKFDKQCFDCGNPIKIYKDKGRWMKENDDGSPHDCKDLTGLPRQRVPDDKDSSNGDEYGGGY